MTGLDYLRVHWSILQDAEERSLNFVSYKNKKSRLPYLNLKGNYYNLRIMKKIILILIILDFFNCQEVLSQVTFMGNIYAIESVGTGLNADLGTNIYAYNSGTQYFKIIRKSNRWYMEANIPGSLSFMHYMLYMTSGLFTDNQPPCCAEWQNYGGGASAIWTGYPNSTPPAATGTFDILTMTSSCFAAESSTLIDTDYIRLPNKSNASISLMPNEKGRLVYSSTDQDIKYNNGSQWVNMWPRPNYMDYEILSNQKILFSVPGTNISGNIGAIDFKIRDLSVLKLDDALTSNTSLTINGSISLSTRIETAPPTIGNLIINEKDCILIYTGSSDCGLQLPDPLSYNRGRIYKILNHGNGNLNIVTPTGGIFFSNTGSLNSINSGNSLTIVSDGSKWRKIE